MLGYHRRSAGALSHADVLTMYRTILLDLIDKKTAAFERKLGAKIDTLYEAVVCELNERGREIGGKKGFGPTKLIVRKIVERLCAAHYHSAKNGKLSDEEEHKAGGVEGDGVVSALDCLVVLLEKDGFNFGATLPDSGNVRTEGKEDEGKDSDEVSGMRVSVRFQYFVLLVINAVAGVL